MVNLNEPPVGRTERIQRGDGSALMGWAPGDGVRYVLIACRMDPVVCDEMGCRRDALLVSLGYYGKGFRSYPLIPGQVKTVDYVAEKFGYKGDELLAFAALVNFALCEPGGIEWDEATRIFGEMRLG